MSAELVLTEMELRKSAESGPKTTQDLELYLYRKGFTKLEIEYTRELMKGDDIESIAQRLDRTTTALQSRGCRAREKLKVNSHRALVCHCYKYLIGEIA